MERNKFEEQLKEQLREREIQPSDTSWERISEQLEVLETPKSKRFPWYGIAATFIGILFLSVAYYTFRDSAVEPEVEITNTPEDIPTDKNPSQIVPFKRSVEDNAVATEELERKDVIQINPIEQRDTKSNAQVASANNEKMADKVDDMAIGRSEEMIQIKVAEIVARVEGLEAKNTTVSDAEIDSLLREAQRQILEDKIFRKDRSVDAMALLADVENELDRSFRDQIFDALKDGFLKVRTAVADRDQ